MLTNLTEEFRRKRSNFHRKSFLDDEKNDGYDNDDDDHHPLISRDDVTLMMNRPMWMIIRDDVENDFKAIRELLQDLKDTQDALLRDTMGKRSEKLNIRNERICANITRRTREMNKKVEQIRRTEGVSENEAKVRKSVSRSLSMRTRRILNDFKECRNQFVQKLSYLRSPATAEGQMNLDDLIRTFNETNNSSTTTTKELKKSQPQQQLLLQVHDNVDNQWVLQRDQDIAKIVRSVAELSDMFYEVSVMIGEQGSILDRIDFNMEIAVDTSKKGVLELEKAEEHQKNDRSIKCIGILVFIIFVLVCVLISKKI